ncbi:CvfD/Ygs/GSP13 family RNA-binding post-transcriptional regulator [Lapidilactobacillus achengensis]|uniref:CvfD/Ygs/GSP13 family RNA-binding post-transcriptional regulator n=1 Tax=Lapidilactobacillus achengensis TaxID=2486000 RepID=A0ABW1UJW9_9LACO|nr:CvfD/Ygs/GSP13 family RNA-binding post-transcriptional regulator [Lapidilactobacillus achengensis]
MAYRIGDILPGRVTGIQPYGVFVLLDDQTQGLIHISECTHSYVTDLHDIVRIGDVIKVLVLDVDEYSQKISLSLRALKPDPYLVKYRRKAHFWTNHRLNSGFRPIAARRDKWIGESLSYFERQPQRRQSKHS